jgi:uncharacterized protein YegP (UPF0339 family)
MKFEFWRGPSREWFWHLKARNGRILCCAGEGFKQFASMVKNVRNCYPDGMRRAMLERDLKKLVDET